jgi:glyoxalase family protein
MTAIPGLHHVTAIAGDPRANLQFYTRRLGQRLVKKTVNFDAPDTYHLYYGDQAGSPGSILTFFPFLDAGPGRAGPGMASAYAYAVSKGRFDGLMEELALEAVDFDGPIERFGQPVITLRDPDNAPVELVGTDRPGDEAGGGVLDGFHSVTLWERDPGPTARLLTDIMGYEEVGSETAGGVERLRLRAPGGARGDVVDIIRSDAPSIGRQGTGTIHHVAFRARSYAEHEEWMERLASAGHPTTPVIDRQYFHAIYFREPGGVLFEIATDPPGFTVDEPKTSLGQALMLPSQHEHLRERLLRVLPPLEAA